MKLLGRCLIYNGNFKNYWDWFFTLTFNPEKVDSFNYEISSQKLSKWLNNMRLKCPDMKYIVVPEKHPTSGRWHFHGLFSNVSELDFKLSGKYTDNGQEIFNVGKYKLGWSTAVKLDGSFAVVGYMTKYITKKLCEITKGKKRYWASRNCDLPIVEEYEFNTSLEDIIEQLDLFSDNSSKVDKKEKSLEDEKDEIILQNVLLDIKNKYGKNSILKGMNLEEGGTTIDRNGQIGGHRG